MADLSTLSSPDHVDMLPGPAGESSLLSPLKMLGEVRCSGQEVLTVVTLDSLSAAVFLPMVLVHLVELDAHGLGVLVTVVREQLTAR